MLQVEGGAHSSEKIEAKEAVVLHPNNPHFVVRGPDTVGYLHPAPLRFSPLPWVAGQWKSNSGVQLAGPHLPYVGPEAFPDGPCAPRCWGLSCLHLALYDQVDRIAKTCALSKAWGCLWLSL